MLKRTRLVLKSKIILLFSNNITWFVKTDTYTNIGRFYQSVNDFCGYGFELNFGIRQNKEYQYFLYNKTVVNL
ncbi:MAG TPA: hypothetical protein DCS93_30240 [Microscillaceae bacterium]|nr:hypothetical protein [Microscillaceae bacterium]